MAVSSRTLRSAYGFSRSISACAAPRHAVGQITYDAYGNFVLDVEAEPAALQPIGDRPMVLDLKGRAVLDVARRVLRVQDVVPTEGTSVPTDLERVRHFEFRDDTLTPTARNEGGQPTGVTIWKRQP